MELHGENEFKVRGYNNAIYNIERIPQRLENLNTQELERLPGIGKSIAARIHELTNTGSMEVLDTYLASTPPGVLELLNIKGLGTKKIRILWHNLGISSISELQIAIRQDHLSGEKGFGKKLQDKILDKIEYYLNNKSKLHYAKAEVFANSLVQEIKSFRSDILVSFTGQLRRKSEIIDTVSLIVGTDDSIELVSRLNKMSSIKIDKTQSSPHRIRASMNHTDTPIQIFICKPDAFYSQLILTTGSTGHLNFVLPGEKNIKSVVNGTNFPSEQDAYKKLDLPYIDPELRENFIEFDLVRNGEMPNLLETSDLSGIIHNHTTYSDGRHTLSEMAGYCKSLGYQYIGISDHSKTAGFYANGLDEDRIRIQQQEIEKLNKDLTPFRIFKGIESDILPDGNLDYDPETLATFDFVVASIHSVLNMDIVKATDRIISAVTNPFTTILGHMTGRLLLIREGYPLDHRAVIDACAENEVIIEVNAHPNRLDIDWRWIPYALKKNVKISINPDAHEKSAFHDMYYGVCTARKGGLTKNMTFNTLPVEDVATHFVKRKKRALEFSSNER